VIDDFARRELVLIAFLGGVAFALGAGAGGWMVWMLILLTD